MEGKDILLEEVLQRINNKAKGKFSTSDKVVYTNIFEKSLEDPKLRAFAKKNEMDQFVKHMYPNVFEGLILQSYDEFIETYGKLDAKGISYLEVMEELGRGVYEALNQKE